MVNGSIKTIFGHFYNNKIVATANECDHKPIRPEKLFFTTYCSLNGQSSGPKSAT